MGDSQQPKSAAPRFEVPDLELEPMPRTARSGPAAASAPRASAAIQHRPDPFDDARLTDGPSIDLAGDGDSYGVVRFAAGASFDALGDMQLEGNLQPGSPVAADASRHAARAPESTASESDRANHWPSGQAPARERLARDALEVALLAGYGEPPTSGYRTLAYAYRVFVRQRALKRELGPLEHERQRAETEREDVLAQLARAARPEAERVPQFQRLFGQLLELEQLAAERGQALGSVNTELATQASALDSELVEIKARLHAELAQEAEAKRAHDERDAAAKRAEAKLKRMQIEMRAVTQVAEQKLGPKGGTIPEPEASQLAALKERARAVEPEVSQAQAELRATKVALASASASVRAARQSERYAGRKKQALVLHYQQELDQRGRALTESEARPRAVLVEIARAVLGARGVVAVAEPWLAAVTAAGERADTLAARCELHLRALDAFDRPRAAQGVRLAATALGIALLMLVLKIAL